MCIYIYIYTYKFENSERLTFERFRYDVDISM